MADIRHRERGFGQHTFSVGKNFEVENFQLLRLQLGHPFWCFVENHYCALKISPIFIKFSPNVSRQCMQNMTKL
jgi:hypothetical protein